MLYCSRCGSTNPDGSSQCTSCGEALTPPPATPMGSPFASQGSSLGASAGGPSPTYLVQSILVTIFCCQVFGIVAIVFAAMASGKNSSGDYAEAADLAAKAKTWCWVGFGLGLLVYGVTLVLGFVGALAGPGGP